jgi:hypothetical protein
VLPPLLGFAGSEDAPSHFGVSSLVAGGLSSDEGSFASSFFPHATRATTETTPKK